MKVADVDWTILWYSILRVLQGDYPRSGKKLKIKIYSQITYLSVNFCVFQTLTSHILSMFFSEPVGFGRYFKNSWSTASSSRLLQFFSSTFNRMQRFDDRMPMNSISYSMIQTERSPEYSGRSGICGNVDTLSFRWFMHLWTRWNGIRRWIEL